ncbi:LPD29 domain-containing protein [Nocardia goodfellowii]
MVEIPEAAKLWKQALRAQWPGVRWSVRSAPRGWFTVITAWEDGPTPDAVAVFCQAWKTLNPDAATWIGDSGFRRGYSPAGYATVIGAITRDIPEMPMPRTLDGGLDIRVARALTWSGPVKVARRFYATNACTTWWRSLRWSPRTTTTPPAPPRGTNHLNKPGARGGAAAAAPLEWADGPVRCR